MVELSTGTGNHKYKVKIGNKTVQFGAKGYIDFTKGATLKQKSAYINRHKKRENWGASGIETAGFWAKNLLWNKNTIKESLADVKRRFNL